MKKVNITKIKWIQPKDFIIEYSEKNENKKIIVRFEDFVKTVKKYTKKNAKLKKRK